VLIAHVLGTTEVEADGTRVELGGPLPRRLVTALLAADGRPVSEDVLTEAVWGDEPPANPTVSLQAYVSRLRRQLGRHPLARVGDGYRLAVDDTDAARFAADVGRGRQLLDDERPGEALRAFDTALARWRGEAFADLPETYARTRLTELRAVAVEERLAARLAAGDAPGAVPELDAAVRTEPYRERRWELLILALYRSGRQAGALAALRRVRARLADELGIDPGPALQELEGRLLAQDPRLLLPSRPAPAVRPLSHFFGRAAELAALDELTAASRLVSLVGPGGAGKTRLAVEFAAARQPWFVRLADVADAELVPATVAATIGVRGSTVEAMVAALGERPGLLLLDNCEHLVAAVAELTIELLARCPELRVLATSREPLGVDGERLLPVAPLPAADAVALLTDRITAGRPGWRPDPAESAQLDELAAALDGIPLALELAAARARVLSLGDLLEMLHDRFPVLGPVPRGALAPHQTLEAAVAWSIDLLSAADRAVVLRLWPFEGGFPLSALEDDLDALSSLVARSVVVADTTVTPTRYRLLEIVRAYCREHDPDPAGSRAQHAAWVRTLAERLTRDLRGVRSAHAIRLLNRELANLRAGIVHDLVAAPAAALRTAGRLEWFWFRGGHVDDGLRLLRAALAGAPDAPPTDRARAWAAAATLRALTGDIDAAAEDLGRAVETLGDDPDHDGWALRAQLHYYESLLQTGRGDHAAAVEHGHRAVAVARRFGAEWQVANGTMALGWALVGAGETSAGRATLAEAIAQAEAIGQRWTTAMSTLMLARARLRAPAPASASASVSEPADPAAALGLLRRAASLFAGEDDVGNVLACLHTGAYALTEVGRMADGAALAAAVEREATRRGLSAGSLDPIGTAALEAALARADRSIAGRVADTLDEPAMLALLAPGND
jgi:predicted ATPase/DNA-binding SARP family transcriptional activator